MTARKKKATKKKATKKKKATRRSRASIFMINRRVLARLVGCSLRRVTELEAEGIIVPARRGKGGRASIYAAEVVIPAYIDHMAATPASAPERDARRRRDIAQAELLELKLAVQRKEFYPAAEIILAGQTQVKSWTAKIRALPRQMVQTGIISRDVEQKASDLLRALLTEISNWKSIDDAKKSARRKL